MSIREIQVPKRIKVCDACNEDIAEDAVQDKHYFVILAKINFSRETRVDWVVSPLKQFQAQIEDGTAAHFHVHADCTDKLSGNLLRDLFVNVEVDD